MPGVVLEVRGALGLITLDRPEALHALDLPMIRAVTPALDRWEHDPQVHAVVIRSTGPRAFCAGGDIRRVCEARQRGEGSLPRDFFREEYALNLRIHRFPKPYIALLDGITMGGGVGLSVYGSHRVATEHTVVAMPETGIGLFPDVGGGYFLPRLPDELGTYLALTGARLGPADALAAGIATHFVSSARLPALLARLEEPPLRTGAIDAVSAVLASFAEPAGAPDLAPVRKEIREAFGGDSVEGILARLRRLDSPWARETLESLASKSPTSLKVTLRLLREGARRGLEEELRVEYRLTQRFVGAHDFCEGVRAALVDRDHLPRWRPSGLEQIAPEDLDAWFAPLEEGELLPGQWPPPG